MTEQSEKVRATWPTPEMKELRFQCRGRDDAQRAIQKIDNQIKAICRRSLNVGAYPDDDNGREAIKKLGQTKFKELLATFEDIATDADHDSARAFALAQMDEVTAGIYSQVEFFFQARVPLLAALDFREKHISRLAKTLPVYKWVKSSPEAKGVGDIMLGRLIGATGTLETYDSYKLVCRRMGTSVVDGFAQGRRSSADEALRHGYKPWFRSLTWNIAGFIKRAVVRSPKDEKRKRIGASYGIHPLGEFYAEEKARLLALNESGAYAERAKIEVAKAKQKGVAPHPDNVAGRLSASHIENRVNRRVFQKFVQALWKEWKRTARGRTRLESDNHRMPSASAVSLAPAE